MKILASFFMECSFWAIFLNYKLDKKHLFAIVKIRPKLTILQFGIFFIVDKEKFPYDRGDISFEMKSFE